MANTNIFNIYGVAINKKPLAIITQIMESFYSSFSVSFISLRVQMCTDDIRGSTHHFFFLFGRLVLFQNVISRMSHIDQAGVQALAQKHAVQVIAV